ncbi:Hsp70 nucleotide exchange factor FES1 [Spathaspora passalidarum NRRL Y-27907]|uniref:Hsp70 nucleotide exchange factor FES1 n=1 Tax=Spathaspora passalidarum (strain NRRL Y-27907 / 11-Y1) TaxID=619300 RepID=G3ATW0_SPAPN|nr:Hsp70 nucleotide exchange factor FES1 [Spathaspora passalidarum NRRL Y-27907]EGW30335.1 Hsp70 nucleotide exchange factor FES1 [Spathaspora passalidarum NRRL Y-27907]
MDKLLQWSIAQQSGDQEAMARIGQPDEKMLQQLFGGPDEPTLMKQSITLVNDPEVTLENKEIALENFEMLIENLDNANNIENLKLWPSIVNLLDPTSPESLRLLACSIIGTAVQNNPKSQEDFSNTEGINHLIQLAHSDTNKQIQLKALYAISSFIRNYKPAYTQFEQYQGWNIIQSDTTDSKRIIRVLSIVSSILSNGIDTNTHQQIKQQGLPGLLVSVLHKDSNVNLLDKAINIIVELHNHKYEFTDEEISSIKAAIQDISNVEHLNKDDLDAVTNIWA